MDDVAEAAGVSRALVSLVMRASPKVSDERRRRVLDVAERLGYRPNGHARDLAGRASGTIGVLLNDLHNPFFARIYDGIEEAAAQADLGIVLTVSHRRDAGEAEAIERMLERRVEGLILAGPRLDVAEILAAARFAPTVVVGREVSGQRCDAVVTDERLAARLVVEHLAALGHRRIAHVEGSRGGGATARSSGVVEATGALGLPDPLLVPGDFTEQAGAAAAAALLRSAALPTAVFAANDLVALGMLAAFDEAGVRVPEDVSIVGFDNTPFAGFRHVALTTVDQGAAEMGRVAVERLLVRRARPDAESVTVFATPGLVVRQTTTAPRRREPAA